MSRCNDTDENGERKRKVNSSTMKRWVKDDFEAMKMKGKKGVKGKPHWYVEKHTRCRNSLSKPGPGPTLGKAEDVLCVKFARELRWACRTLRRKPAAFSRKWR